MTRMPALICKGSPPQVRGKPAVRERCLEGKRITPAGAGKTVRKPPAVRERWDHPRRCGENRSRKRRLTAHIGSPPQVRGKPSGGGADDRTVRITPAGAGKTRVCKRTYGSYRDHPRRCGENCLKPVVCAGVWGSPPQVRGKLPPRAENKGFDRITPAGAGKTSTKYDMPNYI